MATGIMGLGVVSRVGVHTEGKCYIDNVTPLSRYPVPTSRMYLRILDFVRLKERKIGGVEE